MKKHIFYQAIERKNGKFSESYCAMLYDIKTDKISEALHIVFDFNAGDNYGWPYKNLSKEEVDRLYALGQRSFVFSDGEYYELILFDIKFIADEDEESIVSKNKEFQENVKLAKGRKIYDLVEKFVNDNNVSNFDSIYKDDALIPDAEDLVYESCKIIGLKKENIKEI